MLRVLIVDDTRISRESLAAAVAGLASVGSVTTASGATAARAAVEVRPDVALVGLAAPGALDRIGCVLQASPDTRVVAVGVIEEEAQVLAGVEAGVAAFLWHDATLEELEDTMSAVVRDEMPCSPRLAAMLRRRVAAAALLQAARAPHPALTPREAEIVRLLEEGCSNKEIARRLNITALTVKNHVHHILEKLDVRRRGQAAARVRDLTRPASAAAVTTPP